MSTAIATVVGRVNNGVVPCSDSQLVWKLKFCFSGARRSPPLTMSAVSPLLFPYKSEISNPNWSWKGCWGVVVVGNMLYSSPTATGAATFAPSTFTPSFPSPKPKLHSQSLLLRKKRSNTFASLGFGVDGIAEIAQNKLLVASTLAGVVGQLVKPLASALKGDGFDLRTLYKTGGMPSTHSAWVVAAATSIGLERGLSDSIFGLSVAFAAVVMYDAQGVRREVGRHSNALNRLHEVQETSTLYQDKEVLVDSKLGMSSINSEIPTPLSISEKSDSFTPTQDPLPLYSPGKASPNKLKALPSGLMVDGDEESQNYTLLNESVGHTTSQVYAGAILGFLVSLVIESIM